MRFIDLVLPALGCALVFIKLLSKNKLQTKDYIELAIGIIIMGFSIWIAWDNNETIQSIITQANTNKKEITDTVGTTGKATNANVDTTRNIIKAKIDSARKVTVDSMRSINDNTITTLQKTITDQAVKLDSLNKLHGEKELTSSEKKDILNKIVTLTNNAPPEDVRIFLYPYMGANFGKFPLQITQYLKSKRYSVSNGGLKMPVTGQPFIGYEVKGYNQNEIHILIGSF